MSLQELEADVAVVGGGPGGYVAAIKAAQLGLKTVLIEAEQLGGICLNWGCIPTKSLLKSAELFLQINEASKYGINVEGASCDLDKIVERSRKISKQLSSGISHLLNKNKVEVVNGFANLTGSNSLEVVSSKGSKTAKITAKNIILATGASPRKIEGFEPDGSRVWNYKDALVPDNLPNSLAVIGSGAIGIEFANFYHALGVDVTVIEVMDSIMPAEDKEVSAFAEKVMAKRGMKFHTSTKVVSMRRGEDEVELSLDDGQHQSTIAVSHVITAMGVVPNSKNIGLEAVGVQLDTGGFIQTNQYCQTSIPSIYAIGDVAGTPCLAHKASHEGIIAVEAIVDESRAHVLNKKHIPGCTYCFPQVASVGYKEDEAREMFANIKVGRFPFQANGKALAIGEPEGFIKIVFNDDTGELIGVHMVGAEVTELIQGFSIAQTLEATADELAQTIFPHPTLSEMMHESVLDAYNKAIHI